MQELVDSIRLQNWVIAFAIIIIVNNEKQAITIDEKRMDSSIIVLINDHSCDNDNVMLLIRIIELFQTMVSNESNRIIINDENEKFNLKVFVFIEI